MQYQQLGTTGIQVSKLCLGTWELGGDWGGGIDEAVAAVRRAYELGVNFFDTAWSYGMGRSEEQLATVLADEIHHHRESLILSTKGGVEIEGGVARRNSDPAFLRSNLEQSLRRLGTDYVDLFFVHWPDPTVPQAEVAGTVDRFVEEGLVRAGGVSNFSLDETRDYAAGGQLAAVQVPYSLVNTSAVRVLRYCRALSIGVMGYAPLAHGVLAGGLRPGTAFPPDDWRAAHPMFHGEAYVRVSEAVERLDEIATERGSTVAQLALAWVMSQSAQPIPVIGAQLPEHIEASAAAVDLTLDDQEVAALRRVTTHLAPFEQGADAMIGVRA